MILIVWNSTRDVVYYFLVEVNNWFYPKSFGLANWITSVMRRIQRPKVKGRQIHFHKAGTIEVSFLFLELSSFRSNDTFDLDCFSWNFLKTTKVRYGNSFKVSALFAFFQRSGKSFLEIGHQIWRSVAWLYIVHILHLQRVAPTFEHKRL